MRTAALVTMVPRVFLTAIILPVRRLTECCHKNAPAYLDRLGAPVKNLLSISSVGEAFPTCAREDLHVCRIEAKMIRISAAASRRDEETHGML